MRRGAAPIPRGRLVTLTLCCATNQRWEGAAGVPAVRTVLGDGSTTIDGAGYGANSAAGQAYFFASELVDLEIGPSKNIVDFETERADHALRRTGPGRRPTWPTRTAPARTATL